MSQSQPLDLRSLKKSADKDKPPDTKPEFVDREHEFEVSYSGPDGQVYKETLRSRIMDGDERISVARIAARRADVKWDLLPQAQAARIWAQSTIAVQLREPPAWLSRWVMEDDALLFACFDVCSLHESEFFRNSAGEGTEGSAKSRVSVSSTLAASTDRERA
jgi:hypothetical protein